MNPTAGFPVLAGLFASLLIATAVTTPGMSRTPLGEVDPERGT